MKTRKTLTILFMVWMLPLFIVCISYATPMGTEFTYQGRLIDANSAADGLYDFQFKLFDDPCTGSQVGDDVNKPDVDVIDGYFTVELDFNNPCAFNGDARWLEIGIRPGDFNDPCEYTILEPRQEVTPTPYAIYAETAGSAAADSDWIISGVDMYSGISGNVGIGTSTPAEKLTVADGTIKATNSADEGKAIYGQATNPSVLNYGGYFEAAGLYGRGVYGIATCINDSSFTYGGYFEALGPGYNVGACGNGGAVGVLGKGPCGVSGETVSQFGTGVSGSGGSVGVQGMGSHRGVWGGASAVTEELTYGGYFMATGPYGRGVYGIASCTSDSAFTYGGYFEAPGTAGYNVGVYGNGGAIGVKGEGSYYGVYGKTNSTGYAGYFEGGRNYFQGSVGIGTESPSSEAKAHVRTASDNFGILIDSEGTLGSEIGLHTANAKYASLVKNAYYDGSWKRFDTTSGAFLQEITPAGDVRFRVAALGANPITWTDEVAMTISGNVGIGTTSPARKLHVNDVMRLQPRATSPSSPAEGDIYMNSTTHKLMVYDGTTWQACW